MKVHLIVIGKTTQDFVEKGMNEFHHRLQHYLSFEIKIIPDIKSTKSLSFEQQKEKEGELILKMLKPTDYIVLLDERGKEFSSVKFAEYLEKKTHSIPKSLVFIIGGPYGFSSKVYDMAHEKISLSKMTFSHQLIRLIFVEQLYRAMTILHNEPYHHE
ncbi:MAG: 23S rRNA (pseudouridine(1915)-N(3))-methyltransferase RlmH [Dysgonamonadaceae bacterium]|jgi:23S rRNA (pseudouridine1915-N3)-methyltransferase|nr:23S rRNA (pseudouridine(1915)-N(3))-methyltransferase RlmH [Dysgonamonadaceae bacterium]